MATQMISKIFNSISPLNSEDMNEVWAKAVLNGNRQKVAEMIENGFDVNTLIYKRDEEQDDEDEETYSGTALVFAIKNNDTPLAKMLLDNEDTDVNLEDYFKTTPLIYACIKRNIKIAEMLFARADLDVNKTICSESALSTAIDSRNCEIINLFFKDERTNINEKHWSPIHPVHMCLRYKHLSSIKFFLLDLFIDRKDFDPNVQDPEGDTVLIKMIKENNVEYIKKLLKLKKIDPNICNKTSEYPISIAIFNENEEIAELLLADPRTKASIKSTNPDITLLIKAIFSRSERIVAALLKCKDVDVKDAFTESVIYGNKEIIEMLANDERVNLNELIDADGPDGPEGKPVKERIIEHAIGCKSYFLFSVIVRQKRFSRTEEIKDGYTLLMLLAKNGNEDMLKTLLGHEDVNVDQKNQKTGETALMLAKNETVLRLILARSSKWNTIRDNNNRTVLERAVENGDEYVIRVFSEMVKMDEYMVEKLLFFSFEKLFNANNYLCKYFGEEKFNTHEKYLSLYTYIVSIYKNIQKSKNFRP